MNGVGTDGKGGVVNFGAVEGIAIWIDCYPLCEPYFAVNEVKLWKSDAVSVGALYYLFDGDYLENCEPDYFTMAGSYIGSDWGD